jgi:Hsp20/alpha crystallin family
VVERSYGSFSRAIPLPFDPDPATVQAKFDKGVLRNRTDNGQNLIDVIDASNPNSVS